MQQRAFYLSLAFSLTELAKEAGKAILEVCAAARRSHSLKPDQSPLTQADLAAHKCITGGLAKLTPAVPEVSEEDEGSWAYRLPAGTHWLIDPLDGTKEFLSGSGEFTINIALVEDGIAVLGVVFAPALDLLYWGGAGIGAFCGAGRAAAPICVGVDPGESRPLRVVASRSHMNRETAAFVGRLGGAELVQAGSSLKFCRVAEGAADIYPRLGPTCEWDTAAAQAVLEGAGGVVVDLERRPLRYGKPEVLNPSFVAARSSSLVPR